MIQIAAGLVITADDSQYILGRPVKSETVKLRCEVLDIIQIYLKQFVRRL